MAGRPLRNQYSNTYRPGASSSGLRCLPPMHGGSTWTALSHTRLLPRVVVINHGCFFCCMAISQHLRGHTCFHIFNPHKACASSSYTGTGMASSPRAVAAAPWRPRLQASRNNNGPWLMTRFWQRWGPQHFPNMCNNRELFCGKYTGLAGAAPALDQKGRS